MNAHIIESDYVIGRATLEAIRYFNEHPSKPAHDFGHAYEDALLAVSLAIENGINEKTALRRLFLAGIFHDLYRPEAVADASDGRLYASQTAEILKNMGLEKIGLTQGDIDIIADIIVNEHKSGDPTGKYLHIADYITLHLGSRILSFAHNIPVLREHPKMIAEAFERKATEKADGIEKETVDFLSEYWNDIQRIFIEPYSGAGRFEKFPDRENVQEIWGASQQMTRAWYTVKYLERFVRIHGEILSETDIELCDPFKIGKYPQSLNYNQ